jgi:hypothetical protein
VETVPIVGLNSCAECLKEITILLTDGYPFSASFHLGVKRC